MGQPPSTAPVHVSNNVSFNDGRFMVSFNTTYNLDGDNVLMNISATVFKVNALQDSAKGPNANLLDELITVSNHSPFPATVVADRIIMIGWRFGGCWMITVVVITNYACTMLHVMPYGTSMTITTMAPVSLPAVLFTP
jgi:hypothetical protein